MKIPAVLAALAIAVSSTVTPAQAVSPAGYVTGIFLGSPDPNSKVPTGNGVPGAGVANFDIPIPQVVVTHGQRYAITIFLYDASYSGNADAFSRLHAKPAPRRLYCSRQP